MKTQNQKNILNPWASIVRESKSLAQDVKGGVASEAVVLTREQRIAATKQRRLEFLTSLSTKTK